jgi:N-acyl-D-aspartate/D-glutamate deacylase
MIGGRHRLPHPRGGSAVIDIVIKNGTVVDGTGAAPVVADIAIADGAIVEVGGRITSSARCSIDADGALVTPGWVDVHTHYDGQVSWDSELAPSSHNGVTTVVMGNCGVGFVPVMPGAETALIELMEGVEDLICDGTMPTTQLTYWARDRKKGEQLPVEFIVHKQTARNAELYGFADRGTLEVGKRADVNVIDHANLTVSAPVAHHDLPAGGTRLMQPVSGYLATICNGEVTRENDEDTGARPGRLVRS